MDNQNRPLDLVRPHGLVRRTSPFLALTAIFAMALGAAACGDSGGAGGGEGGAGGGEGGAGASESGGGGEGGGGVAVDDAQLRAAAADYLTFTKVNTEPFESAQHMGNPMVNVYVNATAESLYADATNGEPVTFPVGSLIVKEMLDENGAPMTLTAMYKANAGYDAENRDWWWGMLTPEGEPAQEGSFGKLAMCNGCHQGQDDTDAVFGLPN